MSDDDSSVARLVNAILLSSIKKAVHHVAVLPEGVLFWDGEWTPELRPPERLHIPIMQRLSDMIGGFPAPGDHVLGKIHLLVGDRDQFFLVMIDRSDAYRAWIERVDELAFRRRDRPDPPSHPALI